MTMLFTRVKNHCKNNAFEKLKLKSSDLGFSWNAEYKRVESGIQKVGIRNSEPLWILLHGSSYGCLRNVFVEIGLFQPG